MANNYANIIAGFRPLHAVLHLLILFWMSLFAVILSSTFTAAWLFHWVIFPKCLFLFICNMLCSAYKRLV